MIKIITISSLAITLAIALGMGANSFAQAQNSTNPALGGSAIIKPIGPTAFPKPTATPSATIRPIPSPTPAPMRYPDLYLSDIRFKGSYPTPSYIVTICNGGNAVADKAYTNEFYALNDGAPVSDVVEVTFNDRHNPGVCKDYFFSCSALGDPKCEADHMMYFINASRKQPESNYANNFGTIDLLKMDEVFPKP